MTTSEPPPQPPPGESPRRFAMLIAALIGALVLGAVIAHQRAEAAPVYMNERAALLACPPNACNGPGEQPPATTAPVTTVWIRPTTTRPPATTTRRPVTTTTRRPVTTTTRRPVTTTTRRPVTTTTRRPPPTTTRRPVTTTTRRPPPTTTIATTGCDSWACNEVNTGIENDYLPEDFNPSEPTNTADLVAIIEAYGEHNPDFDTRAALQALTEADPDRQADRGDMFNTLAAGLGIPYDPDNPFDVADELADMDILLGHDRDGDGVADPYTRPDADPDSTMTNSQLAAFLNRIPIANDPGGGGGGGPGGDPFVSRPPGGGGDPPGGGGDPDDEMCTTGLALTSGERAAFAAQLRWETLVGIEAQSEPGVPWPPHPDVPGGAEFLVVSQSPVWPVVDPGAQWYAVADDGCLWVATGVQTRVSQLLPWRTDHRRVLENAGTFGVYLRRWDNLTSEQQAQTIQRHHSRDLDVRCPLETAMVSQDSYNQCRWELPVSGVWSWQARACFEADTGYTTYRDCGTLAQGIEWFLGIIDYTSGITLHHDPGGRAGAAPRHPAPAN